MGYTGVFNVLDYSCVSFPTKAAVDQEIDTYPGDYQPLSDTCKAIHDECKLQGSAQPTIPDADRTKTLGTDDPSVVHGMPISLQLVARRLEEEKVIAMTRKVLSIL